MGADTLTFTGFAIGLLGAALIASELYGWAIAAIPLAFAVADPARNALAAAALLAAFIGTGSSFLAFATIAAKRGMASTAYPDKSFFFLGGLAEAGETLAFFIAMCLWPQHFAVLAWVFCGVCGLTIATRIYGGWRAFG